MVWLASLGTRDAVTDALGQSAVRRQKAACNANVTDGSHSLLQKTHITFRPEQQLSMPHLVLPHNSSRVRLSYQSCLGQTMRTGIVGVYSGGTRREGVRIQRGTVLSRPSGRSVFHCVFQACGAIIKFALLHLRYPGGGGWSLQHCMLVNSWLANTTCSYWPSR